MKPYPDPFRLLSLFFAVVALNAGDDRLNGLDERFAAPPGPIPETAELAGSDDRNEISSLRAIPIVATNLEQRPAREAPAGGPPTAATQASLPFAIETVIEPNSAGAVLLKYGLRADPPALENVFDRRQEVPSGQALTLRLGGVSLGVRPVAMVNGRVLSPGQRIEGFNLVHLDRTAAFLEKNGRVLRLPLHLTVRITEEGGK